MTTRLHYCIRCRGYSDVCDLCWGTGKRGRAECRRCKGTGAFVRHEAGCVVNRLPDREFTPRRVVQMEFVA